MATALEHTDLSPRKLTCRITNSESYFLSESSVCRTLLVAGVAATSSVLY